MRDWSASSATSHYVLGSALGPHPYPTMVAWFHRAIGREARRQALRRWKKLPKAVVACVGGGSNAIGIFQAFLRDPVRLVGVEAGGRGAALGDHAARFAGGSVGILHGTKTWVLQDADGQIAATHSVSAGLDYPAVGPQHAALRDARRVEYASIGDAEALDAFDRTTRLEGIVPALESAHAIAFARRLAPSLRPGDLVLVNLSGRGDKDLPEVERIEEGR
jgi:tryptophan synthase beta chain